MAYSVRFGTIEKCINSTKQTFTTAFTAPCLMKETTDILHPVISIQAHLYETPDDENKLLPCNYMYITELKRYYWITNIEFSRGVWYVSGDVDVLASYRTDIASYSCIVERASADYNPLLIDNQIPVTTEIKTENQTASVGLNSAGTVIICCAGRSSDVFYALTPANWGALYAECFSSGFLNSYKNAWESIVQEVRNVALNPDDYISNAIWVPVDYNNISGTTVNIPLGFVNTGVAGKQISPNTVILKNIYQFTLDGHPQSDIYGDWVNNNTLSKITVLLPGYGQAVIDAIKLAQSADTFAVGWAMDCSGVMVYDIIIGSYRQTFKADLSVPVGFAATRSDLGGALVSSVNAISAGAEGDAVGFVKSMGTAITAMIPEVERMVTGGGGRAIVDIEPDIEVNSFYYLLPPYPNFGTIGRPLWKYTMLSAVPGYIKCHNPSIAIEATRDEIEQINDYLAGGFYYE